MGAPMQYDAESPCMSFVGSSVLRGEREDTGDPDCVFGIWAGHPYTERRPMAEQSHIPNRSGHISVSSCGTSQDFDVPREVEKPFSALLQTYWADPSSLKRSSGGC